MLIRNIELEGRLCDIRLEGNRIAAVGKLTDGMLAGEGCVSYPAGDMPGYRQGRISGRKSGQVPGRISDRLSQQVPEEISNSAPAGSAERAPTRTHIFDGPVFDGRVFDGRGGAVIPGLHDHHIHMNALAAARQSVTCGPPEVTSEKALGDTLRDAGRQAGRSGLRGVGYHDSVAGPIDRIWLDRYGPDIPIRIQHRSGRLWIMNSRMMEHYGLTEPHDGRIHDSDHLLQKTMQDIIPDQCDLPDLEPVIAYLLSRGVTGVTEVTPTNGIAEFMRYKRALAPLRHVIMGHAALNDISDSARGPLKLHYHENALPALDDLAVQISRAHAAGRNIASHCVTRAEIMLTLAALEQAGPLPGDRIEHAAIADSGIIDWIRRLDVTVVTQPNFICERADAYRAEMAAGSHKDLWRLGSFTAAGLKIAAGSDAPFGKPDPWAVMKAATSRPDGFRAGEEVTPEAALALYTKPAEAAGAPPRKIEPGAIADLCVLTRPWDVARNALDRVEVALTVIDGKIMYGASL